MPAMRCYTNWNKRPSDMGQQIEPFRKYFFICEGENTEVWYFRRIIDRRKELGIHPLIDIRLMEKTEEDETLSNPKRLFEFARRERRALASEYDDKHDCMVIVFDVDIYAKKPNEYKKILELGKEFILAVTNPSFELFLLLHFENSYEKNIAPKEKELLENAKISNKRRFADKYFAEISGMNPKENPKIAELVDCLDIAIEQEKKLNQDIRYAVGNLTSNIGAIIQRIRNDRIE